MGWICHLSTQVGIPWVRTKRCMLNIKGLSSWKSVGWRNTLSSSGCLDATSFMWPSLMTRTISITMELVENKEGPWDEFFCFSKLSQFSQYLFPHHLSDVQLPYILRFYKQNLKYSSQFPDNISRNLRACMDFIITESQLLQHLVRFVYVLKQMCVLR